MNKQIRILQILDCLYLGGGISCAIFNWHKNIDRNKVQFDYLYFKDVHPNLEEEIKSLGGKCYKLPYPSFIKPWIFIKAIKNFFKEHKYTTIHSHAEAFSFIFFSIAKYYGVKNFIQHSHNTKFAENFLKGLRNKILFFLAKPFITKKLACSDLAGKVFFGKDYTIINYGIYADRFKFDKQIRDNGRKELKTENNFVIGNISRIEKQKNYPFLIEVFNEIYKQKKDSVLLILGEGSLKNKIKKQIDKLNLTENVIFLRVKKDVEKVYQVLDCFVFPSVFEGLGIVAIEAQCSGLPCFISNYVPNEANICNTNKISLKQSAKYWASYILEKNKNFVRKDCSAFIKKAGFDIKDVAKQIEEIYLNL